MAKPEEVGFSADRMRRINDAIQRRIDEGAIPGAVTLVSRKGRVVHFEAQGFMDIDAKQPMQKDSVFGLASMTKPITATAILMLMEQGKLRLNDPISRFIPEFKNVNKVRVLAAGATREAPGGNRDQPNPNQDPGSELVPLTREITVRDLLTHTSGLMSIAVTNPAAPPRSAMQSSTLATLVPRFALPLDFQPGTRWAYSNWAGFDVLARVVEVASGKPYDQFLKENILDPLDMKDTGFKPLADSRAPRFARPYRRTPNGLAKGEPPTQTDFITSPTYFSGAAGLSSTAEDSWRFAQMLANGGEFNGKRLLSPNTVELMRSNQVGDLFPGSGIFPPHGSGFGLSVAVVTDHIMAGIPEGTFGWDGAFGCQFLVSPKENMVMVIMIQISDTVTRLDFQNAVMQAITQ
jgi:CubicO group peptidase (beta-lactamase class C family)